MPRARQTPSVRWSKVLLLLACSLSLSGFPTSAMGQAVETTAIYWLAPGHPDGGRALRREASGRWVRDCENLTGIAVVPGTLTEARLRRPQPRQCEVVALRPLPDSVIALVPEARPRRRPRARLGPFAVGMSQAEVAGLLGVSESAVPRDTEPGNGLVHGAFRIGMYQGSLYSVSVDASRFETLLVPEAPSIAGGSGAADRVAPLLTPGAPDDLRPRSLIVRPSARRLRLLNVEQVTQLEGLELREGWGCGILSDDQTTILFAHLPWHFSMTQASARDIALDRILSRE